MTTPTQQDLENFTVELPNRFTVFDIVNVAPKIWPHVFVLAIESGPRFRVCVTGSHIDDHVHRNCAGLCMDDIIHGPRSANVLGFFEQVLDSRHALKVLHQVALPGRPVLSIFATARPLYDAQDNPSHIVGSILFSIQRPSDEENIRFEIQELYNSFDYAV